MEPISCFLNPNMSVLESGFLENVAHRNEDVLHPENGKHIIHVVCVRISVSVGISFFKPFVPGGIRGERPKIPISKFHAPPNIHMPPAYVYPRGTGVP